MLLIIFQNISVLGYDISSLNPCELYDATNTYAYKYTDENSFQYSISEKDINAKYNNEVRYDFSRINMNLESVEHENAKITILKYIVDRLKKVKLL